MESKIFFAIEGFDSSTLSATDFVKMISLDCPDTNKTILSLICRYVRASQVL
jgi:hypothetical protein